MDKKVLNTIIALTLVIGFFAGAVGGGVASFILFRGVRRESSQVFYPAPPSIYHPASGWYSSQPAAPNSVEAQLRAKGKHWIKTGGSVVVGAYVQDTLEGRMNQPQGRGAIGKVIKVSGPNDAPPPCADVDFGRGYVTGIQFTELSVVQLQP